MNERIKQLRKKLGLTLEKFGERIGVSKMTISRIENGVNNVTEQMFKSICREFNVDEEWLRTGASGPDVQFKKQDTFCLEDFLKTRGATDLEIEIIKTYFQLDPEIRDTIINNFANLFNKKIFTTAAPASSTPPEDAHHTAEIPNTSSPDSVSAAEAAYEKSLGIVPSTSSTASSTIKDTENAG